MMNRILKRPMFRMGGRSDDGIMSVRRGYAIGDTVKGFGSKSLDLVKSAGRGLYNLIPEEGLLSIGARKFPATTAALKTTGLMTAPFLPTAGIAAANYPCLLYTSPSPRDRQKSRMPSSA